MNCPLYKSILNNLCLAVILTLFHLPLFSQGDTLISFWQGSYTPNIINANITVTDLTEGPGITYYDCGDHVAADGFDQPCAPDGLANGDYWEFTITPDPGYEIIYNWFEVQQRASFNSPSEVNTLGTVYWKIGNGNWVQSNITARVDPKPSNFCTVSATRRPHYPNFTSAQAVSFRIVRYIYDNDQHGFSRVNRNGYTWVSGVTQQALPVELSKFEAYKKGQGISLEWETASEINNMGFQIEHSSDGRSWDVLDFVEGNGTTTETWHYNYQHKHPLSGVNYYRLKQMDLDGQTNYSDVVAVEYLHERSPIQIFPNPTYQDFSVSVNNVHNEKMKIQLSDHLGRKVWESNLITNEQTWRKSFHQETPGVYMLMVQIGKEVMTEKVVLIDKR